MKRGRILLAGSIAVLGACRSISLPPDDRPFATESPLASLSGCFGEEGQAAAGERVPMLSAWLWPGEPFDDAIAFVAFEPVEGSALDVRAWSTGRVVRTRRLLTAEARTGPFRIRGGTWFPPFTGPGDEPAPLVGVYGERVELGLDTRGDLEIRRKDWVFGLVYLLVPVLMTDEQQVRFPRVACPESEPPNGSSIPANAGTRVPSRETETDGCYTDPAEAG